METTGYWVFLPSLFNVEVFSLKLLNVGNLFCSHHQRERKYSENTIKIMIKSNTFIKKLIHADTCTKNHT